MKKQKMYTEHDFYHRVWKSKNLYAIYRNLSTFDRYSFVNPLNIAKRNLMNALNAQNVPTSTAIRIF